MITVGSNSISRSARLNIWLISTDLFKYLTRSGSNFPHSLNVSEPLSSLYSSWIPFNPCNVPHLWYGDKSYILDYDIIPSWVPNLDLVDFIVNILELLVRPWAIVLKSTLLSLGLMSLDESNKTLRVANDSLLF